MDPPLRILVVDDDAGIRDMLGLALRSAGHEVELADGRDSSPWPAVDVVLLDWRLGNRTAAEFLRTAPSLAVLPTVLMSASSDTASVRAAMPGAPVVSKPFDLRELEARLRDAVNGRR